MDTYRCGECGALSSVPFTCSGSVTSARSTDEGTTYIALRAAERNHEPTLVSEPASEDDLREMWGGDDEPTPEAPQSRGAGDLSDDELEAEYRRRHPDADEAPGSPGEDEGDGAGETVEDSTTGPPWPGGSA